MKLLKEFEALQQICPGFLSLEYGPNTSQEGFSQGYCFGLVAEFSDKSALENYLAHPTHCALAERLICNLATSADRDIMVFDLDIP